MGKQTISRAAGLQARTPSGLPSTASEETAPPCVVSCLVGLFSARLDSCSPEAVCVGTVVYTAFLYAFPIGRKRNPVVHRVPGFSFAFTVWTPAIRGGGVLGQNTLSLVKHWAVDPVALGF